MSSPVLSPGASAEARESIGWIVVGGLGFATLFTLFLTPVAYALIARFSPARASESQKLARELELHALEAEEERLRLTEPAE